MRTLAIVLIFFASGCAFHLTPVPAEMEVTPPDKLSDARVLVLLPEDFTDFVLSASYDLRDIRYAFGEAALPNFQKIILAVIPHAEFHRIAGGPLALQAELSRSRESFDYVALPRFRDYRAYTARVSFYVEVGIEVEFLTQESNQAPVSVRGAGTGSTSWYFEDNLETAGRNALSEALDALFSDLILVAGSL